MKRKKTLLIILFFLFLFCITHDEVFADGTETLGMPGIPIASGSGIVTAGTGLCSQPGSIELTVPGNSIVKQVLLYWEGSYNDTPGDNKIRVSTSAGNCNSGAEVTGIKIGGNATYRADITNLQLIQSGSNTLYVCDLDFDLDGIDGECDSTTRDDGAGILVIYDDGSTSVIQIRDGNDSAFCPFDPPFDATVEQTFTFAPKAFIRPAEIALFVSSVEGTTGSGPDRPNQIQVTTGGATTTLNNLLNSNDGDEWDTVNLSIPIPANASNLKIQVISWDDPTQNLCASLFWNTAALSISKFEGCTPGYWKQSQHFDSWIGYSQGMKFDAVFGKTITIQWSSTGQPQPLTNPTLLQALQANGGDVNALARHAVAALLNAANSDVNYLYSTAEVIQMVNNALGPGGNIQGTKDLLQEANQVGCPLD